jgi:hypothetical protein
MSEHSTPASKPGRNWRAFVLAAVLGFLMIAIMFPCSHGLARPSAKRIVCAANMNGIGKGVILYQNENKDRFPPDLAALAESGLAGAGMLQCPLADNPISEADIMNDFPFKGIDNMKFRQRFPAFSDYIYIRGLDDKSGHDVMMFELPMNHGQNVVNMLLADGKVVPQAPPHTLLEELQATNNRSAQRRNAQ